LASPSLAVCPTRVEPGKRSSNSRAPSPFVRHVVIRAQVGDHSIYFVAAHAHETYILHVYLRHMSCVGVWRVPLINLSGILPTKWLITYTHIYLDSIIVVPCLPVHFSSWSDMKKFQHRCTASHISFLDRLRYLPIFNQSSSSHLFPFLYFPLPPNLFICVFQTRKYRITSTSLPPLPPSHVTFPSFSSTLHFQLHLNLISSLSYQIQGSTSTPIQIQFLLRKNSTPKWDHSIPYAKSPHPVRSYKPSTCTVPRMYQSSGFLPRRLNPSFIIHYRSVPGEDHTTTMDSVLFSFLDHKR
jgi:hypothetical protein